LRRGAIADGSAVAGSVDPAAMLEIIEAAAVRYRDLQLQFAEFKLISSKLFDQQRSERLNLEDLLAAVELENSALKAQAAAAEEEARTARIHAWNVDFRLWQAENAVKQMDVRSIELERQNQEMQAFLSEVSQSLRTVSAESSPSWNPAALPFTDATLPLRLTFQDS
jgi:hypothetical protein